jgi:hypothetical protein
LIPSDEMTAFANFLREGRIPTSREMSLRSIQLYEENNGEITPDLLRQNFSQILMECILCEKRLFQDIDLDLRQNWARDLLNNDERQNLFPTISRIMQDTLTSMRAAQTDEEKLSSIVSHLVEINDKVSMSQKNSAKSRSGSAFENYLEHFFTILGFQYQRQILLDSGEILDLIFPDFDTMQNRPQDCIMMECQTTLKDRFRLSLGKGQSFPTITKFIATATGANIITDSDHADLSESKINEIRDKQYRLVSFRQVAEGVDDPTVISFENFIDTEYPSRSNLWQE